MNRNRMLKFAIFIPIVLGCSATARADVALTVAPLTLTFNPVARNTVSAAQQVQVSASVATTVMIQVNSSSSWLAVDRIGPLNIGTTATTLNVTVNTQNLQAGGYVGSFTVSVSATDYLTVNVSLTVLGASILSATPASVAFAAQLGASSAEPASAKVQIQSSGATLLYTLQTQTTDGQNWLQVDSAGGTTGDPGFNVSVNPSNLKVGSYSGAVTAFSTTTPDTVQIGIALAVNPDATLTVSPLTPPPFLYQTGSNTPPAQQLLAQQVMVSATGGSVQFSVQQMPPEAWLTVSPLAGSAGATPAPVNLTVTPAGLGLSSGSYNTNIIVTPADGEPAQTVAVTLEVGAFPLLQLSTNALSYAAQFDSNQAPPDQQVALTATNSGAVGFSVSSDSPWLTATPASSTTPSMLTVHVNSNALTMGNFTGNITVKPTNGDAYSENIAVSAAVTTTSQLTAGPADLLFSYLAGALTVPAPQMVQIQSSGQPTPFTVTTATSNCGASWLMAASSNSTTPAALTVTVAPNGIAPGICSGTVTLNYNSGTGQATLPILVTVAVSGTSELIVSPPLGFGVESVTQGAAAFSIPIPLTSTDPITPVLFSATTTSVPGTWLGIAGNTSGSTPQNLSVQILPGGLAPGQYSGNVTISSPSLGSTQVTIPVMLTVTSNVTVSLTPAALSFTEAQGGPAAAAGLPAQTLALASTGGTATFTAGVGSITGGSNWLQIAPASGPATGAIQISVLPNSLSHGTYTAQILVSFQNAATVPITVPVVLTVTAPQTLSVSSTTLSFGYQTAGLQPAPQQIAVSSTGGGVAFSIGTTSTAGTASGGWLSVDSASGTTPKNLNISVNTSGLQTGTYTGSITISAPGVLANPVAISVTLTVTPAPPPMPLEIYNAASGVAGAIAPGEIITITGSQLGPASPASGTLLQVNSKGTVASTLAGVQVLFDNIAGTPIFVSAGQINVVVPYEIAGRVSTNIVVAYNAVESTPIAQLLANSAPGFFTVNLSGTGTGGRDQSKRNPERAAGQRVYARTPGERAADLRYRRRSDQSARHHRGHYAESCQRSGVFPGARERDCHRRGPTCYRRLRGRCPGADHRCDSVQRPPSRRSHR